MCPWRQRQATSTVASEICGAKSESSTPEYEIDYSDRVMPTLATERTPRWKKRGKLELNARAVKACSGETTSLSEPEWELPLRMKACPKYNTPQAIPSHKSPADSFAPHLRIANLFED